MKIEKEEMADIQHAVYLMENDVLIRPIPDYYKPKISGGFSTHVAEDDPYSVGVVEAAGVEWKGFVGHVAYYVKGAGVVINMNDKFGKLVKVNVPGHVHLFRLDETVTINP